MPLPRPDSSDQKINPAPPAPSPEVVGMANALNLVRQIMEEKGQDVVDKTVLDTALQQIQQNI